MQPKMWMRICNTVPAVILLSLTLLCGLGCRSPRQREARFLASGQQYLKAGDLARAIIQFRSAVRAMPADPEAHYQLGLAYLQARDPAQAALALRRATELNPHHSQAQLKLAQLMLASTNRDLIQKAQLRIQQILSDSPANADALYLLAASQMGMGEAQQAAESLGRALERQPQHLKSAAALALLKLRQNDPNGAEAVLKKLVDSNSRSADAAALLGSFYVARQPAQAEAMFLRAAQIDPKNGPALLQLAALQLRAGRRPEAEQTYKRISELPDRRYRPVYATYLMTIGKTSAGIAEFEKLAGKDPGDRAARDRLTAAYLAAGRVAEAQTLLTKALKANPKDVGALLQRAQISISQGKYPDAESDAVQVLHYQANSADAHYVLAVVQKARGSELQQRQELNEAVRLRKGFLQARIELANLLIAARSPQVALNLMNEAPEEQRTTLPYLTTRNRVLIALGDLEGARKGVAKGLTLSRSAEFLVQDGWLKLLARDFRGCRASSEEALRAAPEDARAFELLGTSYVLEKQREKGIQRLREHVAQHPHSAPLQLAFGQWLRANGGSPEEVRAVLQAAKAADPKSPAPDLALARLDASVGQLDRARQTLSALLTSDPSNTQARHLLGMVEDKAGRPDAAREQYRMVLKIDPANIIALNNLAYHLAEDVGQFDEALQYAQKAKELAPNDPAIDDTLGWILYHKGLYPMARIHLERAAATGRWASAKYHLGAVCLKLGDLKRGTEELQAALSLDPKLPEAASVRQLLAEAAAKQKGVRK